jgi:hypothetical protein
MDRSKIKIAALGYVGINATDAPAWARFGPEILGLRAAAAREDGTIALQMDERAYRLRSLRSTESASRFLRVPPRSEPKRW